MVGTDASRRHDVDQLCAICFDRHHTGDELTTRAQSQNRLVNCWHRDRLRSLAPRKGLIAPTHFAFRSRLAWFHSPSNYRNSTHSNRQYRSTGFSTVRHRIANRFPHGKQSHTNSGHFVRLWMGMPSSLTQVAVYQDFLMENWPPSRTTRRSISISVSSERST